MANTLEQNFIIAAKLEPAICVKIQAMLRCLQENTNTCVDLIAPEHDGGNTVAFNLLAGGNRLNLQDCCDLRNVTLSENNFTTCP
ncbi:hypothetical protein [Colwellia sp. MB02u-14]|uniref:hypothetical protein n=1 Tax=Colwellia sp. MB02u-14 TaxID=2759815 RepID=UPI0015F42ED8|nr:hypothetical protein [Colwellia sp. MB02u-14]MBA6304208.1 hypothetical protein [Colwellia sp. MB02u-14]